MDLNKNQIDSLVRTASKKLGVSEDKLRKELEAGTFDRLMAGMSKTDSDRLTAALSNPATAQALLSSPQARELMKKLFN